MQAGSDLRSLKQEAGDEGVSCVVCREKREIG
jgi:hypothetical protein